MMLKRQAIMKFRKLTALLLATTVVLPATILAGCAGGSGGNAQNISKPAPVIPTASPSVTPTLSPIPTPAATPTSPSEIAKSNITTRTFLDNITFAVQRYSGKDEKNDGYCLFYQQGKLIFDTRTIAAASNCINPHFFATASAQYAFFMAIRGDTYRLFKLNLANGTYYSWPERPNRDLLSRDPFGFQYKSKFNDLLFVASQASDEGKPIIGIDYFPNLNAAAQYAAGIQIVKNNKPFLLLKPIISGNYLYCILQDNVDSGESYPHIVRVSLEKVFSDITPQQLADPNFIGKLKTLDLAETEIIVHSADVDQVYYPVPNPANPDEVFVVADRINQIYSVNARARSISKISTGLPGNNSDPNFYVVNGKLAMVFSNDSGGNYDYYLSYLTKKDTGGYEASTPQRIDELNTGKSDLAFAFAP